VQPQFQKKTVKPGGVEVEADDRRLLERASFVCDALYAWCQRQGAG